MLRNVLRYHTSIKPSVLRSSYLIRSCSTSTKSSAAASSLSSDKKLGPVTWASLSLVVLVGGGIMTYYQVEKERLQNQTVKKVKSVGKPLLGGKWTLVDCASKQPVTDASFFGQYTLLYFGFTYCPDICPNELLRIGKVIDSVENNLKTIKVRPLFISVDPARDTIAQMEAYKKDFHPSFVMLTGTKDQIQDVTRAYRVYFSKVDENEESDEEYLVDHSIVMYLVGPDGQFIDFFTQSAEVKDIVSRITAHIQDASMN